MSSGEEVKGAIERVNTSKTHYETLGVPNDCDEKVLKKAYRKLAIQLHPDKCQLKGAEEAFKKVSNAYSCLSNPDSRSHYDRFGSDAPAGGVSGGVDPNDFFRDFMAQNPDFAAGFRAGAPSGGNFTNMSDFNFSAGTLATGRSWWATKADSLQPSWLQPPFRALGVVVFAVLSGFFSTMPYSGMALGGVALYIASQAVWWVLNRLIWLMAISYLPQRIKPRFFLQIVALVIAEHMGFVFDFQRGTVCFLALWGLQNLMGGGPSQPHQSGFSFQTGPQSGFSFQAGPGFVQFGGMPNMGGNMHATRGSVGEDGPQHRRVH